MEVKYNIFFSYKQFSNLRGFEVKIGIFVKWVKLKGYRGRDKKGCFIIYKSFGFVIVVNKKKKGIVLIKFFIRFFENEFNKLLDEIVEVYVLDLDNFLIFIING